MPFYNEMRLSALIEQLEALRDEVGEADPIVRIAHQPHYPFEHAVVNVSCINTAEGEQKDFDADPPAADEGVERPEDNHIIYLAASTSNEYLHSAVDEVWGGRS